MFYFAQKFNRNIAEWDVSNVYNMTKMFEQANAFRQDLCSWGMQLSHTDVRMMFDFTDCIAKNQDPDLYKIPTAGPFCAPCNS